MPLIAGDKLFFGAQVYPGWINTFFKGFINKLYVVKVDGGDPLALLDAKLFPPSVQSPGAGSCT